MNLESLTLRQILETEGLPRRLIVAFAAACAKDALSKVPDPDPRSVLAVEVATRYGDGEDFTETYLREVADAAYTVCAAAHETYVYAAYTAQAAAACGAACAANLAYHTCIHYIIDEEHYKPLLINTIQTRLTKVEKAIIF